MKRHFRSCWLLAVFLPATAMTAAPIGPAFTYQGRLQENGIPTNGQVDLTFTLWDDPDAGAQIGSADTVSNVEVANGLFTLHVNSTEAFGPDAFNGQAHWLQIDVAPAGSGTFTTLSPRQPVTGGPYAAFSAKPWVTNVSDLFYTGGNVGIGTTAPEQMFSVAGTIQSFVGGFMFPDGTVQASAATGGEGFWSATGTSIFNNNAGEVGIGTNTPDGKLHVAGGPFWTSNFWTKALNISDLHAIELGGGSTNKFGIGTSGGSLYLFKTTADGVESPADYFMSVHPSGNILLGAIGAAAPAAKLDIAAAGEGAELLRFSTERPWVFRQIYTGPSTGLQLLSTSGLKNFEITASSGTNVATFLTDNANPRVGIATTTPGTTLDVNGTTRTKVLEITGADLAEKFPTSGAKAEPGTVMEIDPESPGLLRVARGAYNQRVAGVVSGANDFPAGAILGHLPGLEDAPPIALSGRVWTFCDASELAIEPGNLLTTSDTPGHAMRAADRERSHGTVIGKAMTALALGEKGLVLVLVNLQ